MSTLRRFLVRTRPRFWFYLAGPVLVGLAFGADSLAALVSPVALVLVAYFLLPANGFLYGINDLFDRDVDAANPKKDDREVRSDRSRGEIATTAIAAGLGLLLVVFVPVIAATYLLGFLVLGAAYSAPPFRFKTTPFLDSAANGLYILPGAAAYAALAGVHPPLLVLVGAWLWTMGMHTFSAVPDIAPDREAGIRTTATVLGPKATLGYCGAVWFLSAAVFWLVDPRAGALLLVYPVIVGGLLLKDVAIDRAYWWYPAINTAVGMVFTLAGLWGVVNG